MISHQTSSRGLYLGAWAVALCTGGCANTLDGDIGIAATPGQAGLGEEGALVASSACSSEAILARTPAGDRTAAMQRVLRWIDLQVPYSMFRTFEGYRTDCSGYTSLAWELPMPGAVTDNFPPYANYTGVHEIDASELLPGDALNRRTRAPLSSGGFTGHIRVFGGWIDQDQGTFCELEHYSNGLPPRAMKAFASDLQGYLPLRLDRFGDATLPPPPPPQSLPTGDRATGMFVAASAPLALASTSAARIVDTRNTGVRADASTPVTVTLAGAPAGAIVSVVATDTLDPGYLTTWGAGARPDTSTLNYAASDTSANSAFVAASDLHVFTSGRAHVIVDVSATLTAGVGAGFVPRATRIMDTRDDGSRLAANSARTLPVPPAVGAAVNVTVVNPSADGFARVSACDSASEFSSVNFNANDTRAALVTTTMGAAGLCIVSSVDADVVVDLVGTFASSGGARFVAANPTRMLDTRSGFGGWMGTLAAGATIDVATDAANLPADAVAVVLNVAGIDARDAGFVTVTSCAAPADVSTLNLRAGDTRANLAIVPLSGDLRTCVTSSGAADVVVDLVGVFVP